ncbi:MAG: Hint domain-containing protein [Anaerolineales bacterium]
MLMLVRGMKLVLVGVGLVVLAACAGLPAPGPTQLPTSAVPLTESELKYRLMDSTGPLFFCDPDFYPVARADETDLARERFPEIQAHPEEFQVILERLGWTGMIAFTDEEKLSIYREHKRLAAILFEPAGTGYRFQMRVGQDEIEVTAIEGEIDRTGTIRVTARTPGQTMCPICLSESARIDTPGGPVDVTDLRSGDRVWTLTRDGVRIAVPILQVGSTISPEGHIMIRLTLRDGRVVLASPGHPTVDGTPISTLRAGDSIDGSEIVLVERVPYPGSATYDLLPAGDTSVYWADGVLLGSTLRP